MSLTVTGVVGKGVPNKEVVEPEPGGEPPDPGDPPRLSPWVGVGVAAGSTLRFDGAACTGVRPASRALREAPVGTVGLDMSMR